jgi:hypothetical protein
MSVVEANLSMHPYSFDINEVVCNLHFFGVIFIFISASQYCLFFAEMVHGRQHIRTP